MDSEAKIIRIAPKYKGKNIIDIPILCVVNSNIKIYIIEKETM
jgi:hypothetical protein